MFFLKLIVISVLGSWSLDWEYEYNTIQGPPSVEQEGARWYIIIQPKVRRQGPFRVQQGGASGTSSYSPRYRDRGHSGYSRAWGGGWLWYIIIWFGDRGYLGYSGRASGTSSYSPRYGDMGHPGYSRGGRAALLHRHTAQGKETGAS
jgi:hypothetical protein